jgi:hypothetical protein
MSLPVTSREAIAEITDNNEQQSKLFAATLSCFLFLSPFFLSVFFNSSKQEFRH